MPQELRLVTRLTGKPLPPEESWVFLLVGLFFLLCEQKSGQYTIGRDLRQEKGVVPSRNEDRVWGGWWNLLPQAPRQRPGSIAARLLKILVNPLSQGDIASAWSSHPDGRLDSTSLACSGSLGMQNTSLQRRGLSAGLWRALASYV